jgi:sterol desaturase/sphingolipid hydroxylase (fatty acid hydroxylase superfamily)
MTEPSLRTEFRRFLSHRSPQVIIPALLTTIVALVAVAVAAKTSWSWWDLLVPATILALQPFTEWLVHVYVLHSPSRTIGPVHIDLSLAKKHRAHHADPKDAPLIFIPMPALLLLITSLAALLLTTLGLSYALSGLTVAYAMLLTYEWTHFLIHTSYRPRSHVYRVIWRAHRNHHHRNEHYWFGVTTHLGDRVLGTFPLPDSVPLSPTARTLERTTSTRR